MENTDILTIDGTEFIHSEISKLAKQSPEITVSIKDIHVSGIHITPDKNNSIVLNDHYKENQVVVYKYMGNLILLTGYNKYQSVLESGKENIKVSLISKPVLKRAKTEVYIKPIIKHTPRFNNRNKDRGSFHGPLGQEDQATVKPSRQRNIGY